MKNQAQEHLALCVSSMKSLVDSGAFLSGPEMVTVAELLVSSFEDLARPMVKHDSSGNLLCWLDQVGETPGSIANAIAEVEFLEGELCMSEPPLCFSQAVDSGLHQEWIEGK